MYRVDGETNSHLKALHTVSSVECETVESSPVQLAPTATELSQADREDQLNVLAYKHGVNRWRLMIKCDCFIIIPICLLYLLAALDRLNISNAQVYGLSKDLTLHNVQYNTALSIFFVPYIVLEIPANYLLKRLKPHVWLSGCMLCFGAVCICQGFVRNYGGLVTTRVLLGVLETGMLPGCFYLLSMWYCRHEAQKRYSFFFCSTSLAGAFGGLIAYGMSKIDGKQGLSAWRWLFIVDGAITCVIAVILFLVFADFPEDARFLSENERNYIIEKLALDVGESQHEQKIEFKRIVSVIKDWKLWMAGVMYFCVIIPSYSYAFFAPTIIKTFGYSTVKTQVYSIFPWICSFSTSMILASVSDYLGYRYILVVLGLCTALTGFALQLGLNPIAGGDPTSNGTGRYVGCFLACQVHAVMPLIICWCNMNFAGHYRKMVGSAWQVGFGNIGGFVATFVYPSKDSPRFRTGFGVCAAVLGFNVLVCSGYFGRLWLENRQRLSRKLGGNFAVLSEKEREYTEDKDLNFVYHY